MMKGSAGGGETCPFAQNGKKVIIGMRQEPVFLVFFLGVSSLRLSVSEAGRRVVLVVCILFNSDVGNGHGENGTPVWKGNILINQLDEAGQSCSRQILLCLGAVRQLGKKEILKPAQPLAEPGLPRAVLQGDPVKAGEQVARLADAERL